MANSEKGWTSYPPPEAKNQSPWRWVILFLGCLMMMGPYYCFDIPAALKTQLENHMGNPSDYEVQFNLLYTLYATPNVSYCAIFGMWIVFDGRNVGKFLEFRSSCHSSVGTW